MGNQFKRPIKQKQQGPSEEEIESLKDTKCTRTQGTAIKRWDMNEWLTTKEGK